MFYILWVQSIAGGSAQVQGCAGEVAAGAGMKEKEKDWWSIAGVSMRVYQCGCSIAFYFI